MRYTKKDVLGMFSRLSNLLRVPNDHTLHLDYNSVYGGYNVEIVENSTGGIHHPLGSQRRNAKEMYLSLLMACAALEHNDYNEYYP